MRVRLILAGRSEYHWTVLAGRSYYESLLKAGAEIYEFGHGLQHSKTLTIDGVWSLVGTPNFATRSLMLNFEVAVAMFDPQIAAQLEAHFENDVKRANRIHLKSWLRRPTRHVLAESVCRLFTPVL